MSTEKDNNEGSQPPIPESGLGAAFDEANDRATKEVFNNMAGRSDEFAGLLSDASEFDRPAIQAAAEVMFSQDVVEYRGQDYLDKATHLTEGVIDGTISTEEALNTTADIAHALPDHLSMADLVLEDVDDPTATPIPEGETPKYNITFTDLDTLNQEVIPGDPVDALDAVAALEEERRQNEPSEPQKPAEPVDDGLTHSERLVAYYNDRMPGATMRDISFRRPFNVMPAPEWKIHQRGVFNKALLKIFQTTMQKYLADTTTILPFDPLHSYLVHIGLGTYQLYCQTYRLHEEQEDPSWMPVRARPSDEPSVLLKVTPQLDHGPRVMLIEILRRVVKPLYIDPHEPIIAFDQQLTPQNIVAMTRGMASYAKFRS